MKSGAQHFSVQSHLPQTQLSMRLALTPVLELMYYSVSLLSVLATHL